MNLQHGEFDDTQEENLDFPAHGFKGNISDSWSRQSGQDELARWGDSAEEVETKDRHSSGATG